MVRNFRLFFPLFSESLLDEVVGDELARGVVGRIGPILGLDHHDGLLRPEQQERCRPFAQDRRLVIERSQEHVLIGTNLAPFLGEHLVVLDAGDHRLCVGGRHLQAVLRPRGAVVAVDARSGHVLLVLHDDVYVGFPACHLLLLCVWLKRDC